MVDSLSSYHREGEGVDVADVFKAVLPRDEALDVDVELTPNAHDGVVVLLVSKNKARSVTPLRFWSRSTCTRESLFLLLGEADAERVWWRDEEAD